MAKNKDLISIGKAAELLGVSVDTLRRWDKLGIITSIRPNGKTRYFSLAEILEKNPNAGWRRLVKDKKQERLFNNITEKNVSPIPGAIPLDPDPLVVSPIKQKNQSLKQKASIFFLLFLLAGILSGLYLLNSERIAKYLGSKAADKNGSLIFNLDRNGFIRPKGILKLSSAQLRIGDIGLIDNLNADYVHGRRPGDNEGDLVVWDKNRTLSAVTIVTDSNWTGNLIQVGYGGTGSSSFSQNGVLYGAGTGSLQ